MVPLSKSIRTGIPKMTRKIGSITLNKARRIVAVALSSLIFFTACAGESQDKNSALGELISVIENSETKLVKGTDSISPKLDDFLECIGTNTVWSFCKGDFRSLENIFESVSELWDFQSLIAELTSVRLTDNDEASLARDKYVQHIRVWRIWLDDLRLKAPTLADLDEGNQEWTQAWTDILSDDAITETFDAVCSALGNAQPEDSDVFKSRIVNICDD
jgi:hypothetical protein